MALRNAAIEPFVQLAKSATGPLALAGVIERALKSKDVWMYGELLDVPAVVALADTDQAASLALLNLFGYGTYAEYKAMRATGVLSSDLPEPLLKKLKQLSLASIASSRKYLPYADLQAALDVHDAPTLEDIIISTMYAGLLQGKLDQREGVFVVHSALGRDVKPDAASIDSLAERIDAWQAAVDAALAATEAPLRELRREVEWKLTHDAAMVAGVAELKSSVEREVRESLRQPPKVGGAGGMSMDAGGLGSMYSMATMLTAAHGGGDDDRVAGTKRRAAGGGGRR